MLRQGGARMKGGVDFMDWTFCFYRTYQCIVTIEPGLAGSVDTLYPYVGTTGGVPG